jgi:methyltransferase (TIGR00027 family)
MTDSSTTESATTPPVHRPASQSALAAAAARAAHLRVDAEPHIFSDPLAESLLGDDAAALLAYHDLHGEHPVLAGARAQVVVRSHVTEAVLAAAQRRGVTQYVVLGAGLDSYAYRVAAPGCTVFEVDHPQSQQDKRARVGGARLSARTDVVYLPVDFETDALIPALHAAGFDRRQPAVVSWLGVSMYLSHDAIDTTLRQLAALPAGSELVFDYMLTESERDEAGQSYVDLVGPTTAERGEPWLSFFGPEDLSLILADAGFGWSRHLHQGDAVPAELWRRTDVLAPARLSVIGHARR